MFVKCMTVAAIAAAAGTSSAQVKVYNVSTDALSNGQPHLGLLGEIHDSGGYEGFAVGPVDGQFGYTIFGGGDTNAVSIDTANPAGGNQHLRVANDAQASPGTLRGAFTPTAADVADPIITMSVDVSIGATGGADYDVVPQAPTQGFLSARVKFNFLGNIFILDDTGGGLSFIDTGIAWTVGSYENLTIEMDRSAGTLDYYYGGSHIYSSVSGIFAGTAFEQVVLLSDNFNAGEVGDFDNLTVSIPAPASLALLGLGGLAATRRRR